jgi:hypothetical protein
VINTFDEQPQRNGAIRISTINLTYLITLLADTYFDANYEFSRVDVIYTHIDGRQSKHIKHRIVSSDLVGTTSWSTNAKAGVWQKVKIIAYDTDGAVKEIGRAVIGTSEDLTL